MSPGDWINHFTVLKTPWNLFSKDEQKTYLPFITNLWLSMDPTLIEIVNEVQKQQVPNRDHYNFFLKNLPKKKRWFQWIKAKKKEYSKDVIDKLAAYYSISSREVYECIPLLSEHQITDVLKQLGISDKIITKMLKEK